MELQLAALENEELRAKTLESKVPRTEFTCMDRDHLPTIGTQSTGSREQSHDVVAEMIIGQSLNLIPPTFQGRVNFVTNILNNVPGYNNVGSGEVKAMITKVQSVYGALLPHFGTPNQDLLWNTTFKTQTPHLLFLGPPTNVCFACSHTLHVHNHPSTVIVFDLNGPLPALKLTLRCTRCCINYRYYTHSHVHMHTHTCTYMYHTCIHIYIIYIHIGMVNIKEY